MFTSLGYSKGSGEGTGGDERGGAAPGPKPKGQSSRGCPGNTPGTIITGHLFHAAPALVHLGGLRQVPSALWASISEDSREDLMLV